MDGGTFGLVSSVSATLVPREASKFPLIQLAAICEEIESFSRWSATSLFYRSSL